MSTALQVRGASSSVSAGGAVSAVSGVVTSESTGTASVSVGTESSDSRGSPSPEHPTIHRKSHIAYL